MKSIDLSIELKKFNKENVVFDGVALTIGEVILAHLTTFKATDWKKAILARKIGDKVYEAGLGEDNTVGLEDAEFDLVKEAVKKSEIYTALIMGTVYMELDKVDKAD